MQVSVESPTTLERHLTIVVPASSWDEAFEKKIAGFAKKANLKGFRAGKVPMSHVKKIYGDSAKQEALSEVIQSSLYAAISQEKLNPVATPSVEPVKINFGEPVEYLAKFEIMPEVSDVSLTLESLEKVTATIEAVDIDNVVNRLLEQQTTWQKVDRAAQEKDQVIIDFRGSVDSKTFEGGEAHDFPLILGSKSMIPGFEEGIMGIKAGEEKTITVKFPDDYFSESVAGKDAEFQITAHKVSEPVLPELTEDMIKKFGVTSGKMEDLREEIKKNLSRELERQIQSRIKNKVFESLMQQNTVEIPKSLIAQEAKRVHDQVHPNHDNQEHSHSDEENAQFNEAAKRNVTLGILIGEFIKKHKLEANKTKVEEQLNMIASSYEKPEEVIKWYKSDKRRLAEIEMAALEDQVLEKLLENVTVTEKKLSYKEFLENTQ